MSTVNEVAEIASDGDLDPESLVDARTVAGLLGIHISTVYRRIRDGEMAGFRENGRYWIRQADLPDVLAAPDPVQARREAALERLTANAPKRLSDRQRERIGLILSRL